jgi:hypothetical protein
MTRLTAWFVYFMFVPTFSAIAQPISPVEKPNIKIGDRWVYRSIDLWKNEETAKFEFRVTDTNGDDIELDRTKVSLQNNAKEGAPSKRKADLASWTIANSRISAGKYVAFAFPLEIGKTWQDQYTVNGDNGESFQYSTSVKVEAWEDVQVPAGAFRALKVVRTASFTHFRPSDTLGETSSEIFWYAPEVKRLIKREFQNTHHGRTWTKVREELIEYEVK